MFLETGIYVLLSEKSHRCHISSLLFSRLWMSRHKIPFNSPLFISWTSQMIYCSDFNLFVLQICYCFLFFSFFVFTPWIRITLLFVIFNKKLLLICKMVKKYTKPLWFLHKSWNLLLAVFRITCNLLVAQADLLTEKMTLKDNVLFSFIF